MGPLKMSPFCDFQRSQRDVPNSVREKADCLYKHRQVYGLFGHTHSGRWADGIKTN